MIFWQKNNAFCYHHLTAASASAQSTPLQPTPWQNPLPVYSSHLSHLPPNVQYASIPFPFCSALPLSSLYQLTPPHINPACSSYPQSIPTHPSTSLHYLIPPPACSAHFELTFTPLWRPSIWAPARTGWFCISSIQAISFTDCNREKTSVLVDISWRQGHLMSLRKNTDNYLKGSAATSIIYCPSLFSPTHILKLLTLSPTLKRKKLGQRSFGAVSMAYNALHVYL